MLVVALAALRRRLLRRAPLAATTSTRCATLYRRRRDVMLEALAEHFPPEATWTQPEGGLFIWATLPDYIDTTDLLARALAEQRRVRPRPRRVPRRPRRLSMRLNFSGVGEDDIREGVRRIGEVVARAGRALRHADRHAPGAAAPERRGRAPTPELADVLHAARARRRRRRRTARR